MLAVVSIGFVVYVIALFSFGALALKVICAHLVTFHCVATRGRRPRRCAALFWLSARAPTFAFAFPFSFASSAISWEKAHLAP